MVLLNLRNLGRFLIGESKVASLLVFAQCGAGLEGKWQKKTESGFCNRRTKRGSSAADDSSEGAIFGRPIKLIKVDA